MRDKRFTCKENYRETAAEGLPYDLFVFAFPHLGNLVYSATIDVFASDIERRLVRRKLKKFAYRQAWERIREA